MRQENCFEFLSKCQCIAANGRQESFKMLGRCGWRAVCLGSFCVRPSEFGDGLEIIPSADTGPGAAKRIDHKWHQWLMYDQNVDIYDLGMYPEFEASIWPNYL